MNYAKHLKKVSKTYKKLGNKDIARSIKQASKFVKKMT